MLRQLYRIGRVGVLTEALQRDEAFELLGEQTRRAIARRFAGSLAIRQLDAGSCNGCELEIHALNNAFYDLERFGIRFVASPRSRCCLSSRISTRRRRRSTNCSIWA